MHQRSTRVSFVLGTLLTGGTLLGCAGESGEIGGEEGSAFGVQEHPLGDPVGDIIGGTNVKTCGWPTAILGNGCTATLIHPEVITSAAHCNVAAGNTFKFGEDEGGSGVTATAKKCESAGSESDWAYCVLESPVTNVPIVPPLYGCEFERFLKAGATAQSVGFGNNNANMTGFGTKREVSVSVNSVGNGEVDIGDVQSGNCTGDSGGPIYLHLQENGKDWGWRMFGSTSGLGSGSACAGTTVFITTDLHVKAIEENEGIDVTPCTNTAGDWDPGPNCKDFPTDPANGGGSWPNCNPGPLTTEPIDSCGMGTGGTTGGTGGTTGGTGGTGGMGGTGGTTGGTGGSTGGAGGTTGGTGGTTGGTGGTTGGTGGTTGGTGGGTGGTAGGTGGSTAGTGGTTGGMGGSSAGMGGAGGAATGGSAGAGTGGTVTTDPTGPGTCSYHVPGNASQSGTLAAVLGATLLGGAAARRRRR